MKLMNNNIIECFNYYSYLFRKWDIRALLWMANGFLRVSGYRQDGPVRVRDH